MKSEKDTAREAQQVLNYVLRRAATDRAFRRALLTDPKRALERALDTEMPEAFSIRFVENLGADLTVVLPDPVARGHHKLSDRELDYVAGGRRAALPPSAAGWLASAAQERRP